MTKRIAIFEPWGLGDLLIALHGARELSKNGFEITVICNPDWASWVKTLIFVKNVITYHAPWTEKTKKYSFYKYKVAHFLLLRRQLKNIAVDYLCDIRGDIRNLVFLKALCVCPVFSLLGQKVKRRYDRPVSLARLFNVKVKSLYSNQATQYSCFSNKKTHVFCFFGSAWGNKAVPIEKSIEIVLALLGKKFLVTIILQPEDSMSEWSFLIDKYKGQLFLLQESIAKCGIALKMANLFIATDSGWLHMAFFYGIPVIALFGYANAEEWCPPNCLVVYSENVLPYNMMYNLAYEHIQPLSEISVTKILETVNFINQT